MAFSQVLSIGIICIFFCVVGMDGIPAVVETEGCDGQLDCRKCNTGGRCVKCNHFIMYGTRKCLDACPLGYVVSFPHHLDYMGQVCREAGILDSIGLSGRQFAILVGACSGAAICVGVLLGSFLYLRKRRISERSTRSAALQSPDNTRQTQTCVSDLTGEAAVTRHLFLQELEALRPDAPVFLQMLNDTRRKIQQQPGGPSGNTDYRTKAYRAVLRDLTRLLTLLNKREEQISVAPSDWQRLIEWAERVLRRYKRQKGGQENGHGNGSVHSNGIEDRNGIAIRPVNGFSSFHPPSSPVHKPNGFPYSQTNGSVVLHAIGNGTGIPRGILKNNYDEEDGNDSNKTEILAEWHMDYTAEVPNGHHNPHLGLRPQDEITTEL